MTKPIVHHCQPIAFANNAASWGYAQQAFDQMRLRAMKDLERTKTTVSISAS